MRSAKVSAMRANSRPAGESGAAWTTGVPLSPQMRTSGSIGIWPSNGASANSAILAPPPLPKSSCRLPAGSVK